MKRIELYAAVLLIAGAILALNVIGVPSIPGSCMVNGTCSQNCTCSDKANCTGNCTCPNNTSGAEISSEWQNDSEGESCPLNTAAGQAGCGTGGKGCPFSTKGKA